MLTLAWVRPNRFCRLIRAAALSLLALAMNAAARETVRIEPLPPLTGTPLAPAAGPIGAVTFHPEGGLLLLEAANQRILHYSRDGRFAGETGGFGFDDGGLRAASDLTAAGFEIWVADPLGGKIARYDTWLAPLEPWRQVLEDNRQLAFERPVSVARSPSGDAVVLERDRAEAWLLDPQGRLIGRIGAFSELEQGLADPRRVEVSADGQIAIADPGCSTVFLFDRFGTPRGRRPWTGPGPAGIAWWGEWLFVAGPERVALLDERGQTVIAWPAAEFGGMVNDIAVSGDRLAVATDGGLQWFRLVRLPGQE